MITAEYNMLPGSNMQRKQRDLSKLKLDNRSAEIQRLVGRSLRSVVELNKSERGRLDRLRCDPGNGGTRVASVTGSFIALYDAIQLLLNNKIDPA